MIRLARGVLFAAMPITMLIVVAGCGADTDLSVGTNVVEIDGVKVELPGKGGPMTKPTRNFKSTSDWGKGPLTFEYDQGRISLDGVDYGTVTAGDRVRVTTTHKLYVNDKLRKPAK